MSDISKIKVGETTYDIKDQAGREAFANSKVTVLDATSDTDHIPVAKVVYDYGQTIKQYFDNAKTTQISANSTDQYVPTARAVYEYIQANGGGTGGSGDSGNTSEGATAFSKYNLGDYYAVKTIHVLTDLLVEDEGDWFDDFVRVSDYTDINSLFYLYAEIEGTVCQAINNVFNAGILEGLPFKAYMFPYQIPFYIIPENFTYEKEVLDPTTGETTIQSVSCKAGLYCPPVDMIISVLEKKDKYLVQKSYEFSPDGAPVLQQFFKVSDDTDVDGLYSALAISDLNISEEGFSIYLDYISGGHFTSLQESGLGLPISTIYCLEGSYYAGSYSAMVVTEETTLPEDLGGLTVAPGTYLGAYQSGDTMLPYMQLVKLQEKELVLDLDEKLGEYTEGVSILEALFGGLESSPTGEFSIEMIGDLENRVGQYSMQLFDIMETAFKNKGEVIFRLSASNGYVDFKLKPHISKLMGTYVGGVTGSMFMEAWMDISLQLVSYQSGVELYCKIKAYLPEQS